MNIDLSYLVVGWCAAFMLGFSVNGLFHEFRERKNDDE